MTQVFERPLSNMHQQICTTHTKNNTPHIFSPLPHRKQKKISTVPSLFEQHFHTTKNETTTATTVEMNQNQQNTNNNSNHVNSTGVSLNNAIAFQCQKPLSTTNESCLSWNNQVSSCSSQNCGIMASHSEICSSSKHATTSRLLWANSTSLHPPQSTHLCSPSSPFSSCSFEPYFELGCKQQEQWERLSEEREGERRDDWHNSCCIRRNDQRRQACGGRGRAHRDAIIVTITA
mmetsp:Transcript_2313/g.8619  ORF Transcript_2313/g.8619 Transcript_2313/m.8619 type:complete len:233 (+) Transcript_2313:877-1575(+)